MHYNYTVYSPKRVALEELLLKHETLGKKLKRARNKDRKQKIQECIKNLEFTFSLEARRGFLKNGIVK